MTHITAVHKSFVIIIKKMIEGKINVLNSIYFRCPSFQNVPNNLLIKLKKKKKNFIHNHEIYPSQQFQQQTSQICKLGSLPV